MNDEPDLDGSLLVEVITYTVYVAWLSILAAGALYLGLPPLTDIQNSIPGWQGTVTAVAAGAAMIAVFRFIYDTIVARTKSTPETPQTEDPQTEDPQTEDPQTEDPQTEDPQTEDPQTEDPQTEASSVGAVRAGGSGRGRSKKKRKGKKGKQRQRR